MPAEPEIRVYEDRFDLSGPTIEFLVGPDAAPVPFHLQEALVCASSRYCSLAVAGPWKESQSRSIRLDDVDPAVFRIYVFWLYRGQFPIRNDAPDLEGNAEYLALARGYVLGDRLQDTAFCDACTDAMIDKSKTVSTDGSHWYPLGPVIACIYDNTTPKAKVRRWLVDSYARKGCGDWLVKWADKEADLPSDFLYDLSVALFDVVRDKSVRVAQPCEYHEHGEEETCYKKLPGWFNKDKVKKAEQLGACPHGCFWWCNGPVPGRVGNNWSGW